MRHPPRFLVAAFGLAMAVPAWAAAEAPPPTPPAAEVVFLVEVALLIAAGRIGGELMQRIGQPAVMGQLIAGIVLGPTRLRHAAAAPSGAGLSTRGDPARHDRRRRPARHPHAAAAHRHGDRPPSGAAHRHAGGLRVGRRHRRALRLRLRRGRGGAGVDRAQSRPARRHLALSRHRAFHRLGQDRGDGGP